MSTQSLYKSMRETCVLNPPVHVTSVKPSVDRTSPALPASVHAVGTNISSQCAIRFPKIHVGITSGACFHQYFEYLLFRVLISKSVNYSNEVCVDYGTLS